MVNLPKYFMLAIILVAVFIFNPLPCRAEDIADSNNKFTFELYLKLIQGKEGRNEFFSPFSIVTAMGMTYEGARGQTKDEMQKVFHFPLNDKTRRDGFFNLINEINKKDKKYQLHTANALWVEKTYKLLDDYLKVIERYYQGKATNVGFIDPTEREQAVFTINGWIEGNTNRKIKNIITPQAVSQDTRLILTNAIYFKGKWQTQFKKNLTKDEDFKVSPNKKVKVPMMTMDMKGFNEYPEFNYTETEDLQAIELPYEGKELSMIILLPKVDLESIEKTLTYERISEIKRKLSMTPVDLYLPRFKFEREYTLKEVFAGMGMPTAFSDDADFSGMDGTKKLKIDDVIHKAFVEVNEEGTEAAAATAVIMLSKASVERTKKPVVFRADHPFIFIIQHNTTGAILFIGKVYEPKENSH
ncbi:serpin B [Thermodesulfovibrio aggregans]|uniref:Serpin B n=1 Tax=Thermodesulfovibrio aggregans TaxID=86166 RepID=A0A0U9I9N2_9BACT|nr:serpin family protein [Thermodesulfovibrio aggregans]GAQ94694.1 serpin B [Thermodesulfovibrio aggregans]